MNQNIENVIKYLDLAEELGVEELKLSGVDVRVLNDHLRTLYEQQRQLKDLIKYLNKGIINLTDEVGSIELWKKKSFIKKSMEKKYFV